MVQNDYRFDLFRDVMLSPVFQYEEKVEDGKTKARAGYSLKHRILEAAGALNGIAQGIVRCSRTL